MQEALATIAGAAVAAALSMVAIAETERAVLSSSTVPACSRRVSKRTAIRSAEAQSHPLRRSVVEDYRRGAEKVLDHYWTDRESAGEMELTDQQSKKFQTFQLVQAYYRQLPAAT